MAMTETQRTTLYNQLTGAIGQEAARTLMEQLPPSGWDQVATKDDVKASEKMLLREIKASEKMLLGEIKESEGRLMIQIADSESRQGTRIDQTNTRIDETNTRIDQTNHELADLKDVVRDGFADMKLALARHTKWTAAVLLGFAASVVVPLMIAVL